MDKDEIVGKAEQVGGKIKEKVGEAFGDQSMANKGAAEQVKGATKETWGKAKDVANDAGDRKATDVRDKVVDSANNLRDKIKGGLDDSKR